VSEVESAKELVRAFAARMDAREWDAFGALLAADVVYEIPQTRERIRGRERYVRFNAEFPGDWHIEPQVVLGDDHDGALLFRWTMDGEESLAIAFFEVTGGLITKVTDFWPEPYEPPPGREHLVERW
jgi:ketosteroid isomerase-like protein